MKVTNKQKLWIVLYFLFFICIFSVLSIYRTYTLKAKENKNNMIQKETQETATETPLATTDNKKTKKITKTKEKYINVWTTANLNIRKYPNTNSRIMGKYPWGTKVKVAYVNDEWAMVKKTGLFINRVFLCEVPIGYKDYDVPNNTIKSYMDYRAITATGSKQYKLQKSAYTGNYGIRMVNGRYCVALGSYYTTKIGQYVDIELANGNVIYGILADCKADRDTDSFNQVHLDGSVVEFVVDTKALDKIVRRMGDSSYVNGWDSKVINIRVYDKVEEF